MEFNTHNAIDVQRLAKDLEADGYSANFEDNSVTLEYENEGFTDIPDALAFMLMGTAPRPSQADKVEVVKWLHAKLNSHRDSGRRAGYALGRNEIIRTVQELLGLDRIAAALEAHIPK